MKEKLDCDHSMMGKEIRFILLKCPKCGYRNWIIAEKEMKNVEKEMVELKDYKLQT